MDLQECYKRMGANFDEVKRRLRKESLIQRILLMFPDDNNYELLVTSVAEKDYHTAFRAIHSLKGISMNLGLTDLIESSGNLTEVLRDENPQVDVQPLVDRVGRDYKVIMEAIAAYKESGLSEEK